MKDDWLMKNSISCDEAANAARHITLRFNHFWGQIYLSRSSRSDSQLTERMQLQQPREIIQTHVCITCGPCHDSHAAPEHEPAMKLNSHPAPDSKRN